ncbi:hypothetical protein FRC10_002975, partial [Ceratobasidium sp. 414]
MDRARIDVLGNELEVLQTEMSALNARARVMTKAITDVGRCAGTIGGRVEVFERHGNGLSQSVA